MIKFWKEDFKYIKRSPYTHFFVEGFGYTYTFSIRGESANYLINKYNLKYPCVKVSVNCGSNAITLHVISETDDKSQFESYIICGKDLRELLSLLQEIIDIDQRNYYEYICNDCYTRDSRWK